MVPKKLLNSVLLAALVLPAVWVVSAHAQQDPARGVTVTDRPRPEVEPLGIRAGSFLIFPAVDATEQFQDNIFFREEGDTDTPNDIQGDFITVFSPEISVQSDWGTHALNFFGGADVGLYWVNDDEDYFDWQLGVDGRYDITRNTNVTARFDFANRHESRGSPDDVSGKHPIFYNVYGPSLAFFHRFNRVSIEVGGSLAKFDFEHVQVGVDAINGQLTEEAILIDDRNRREVEGNVRIGYEIVPNYEAFVRGAYNDREYDLGVDFEGFDRDSNGWDAVAGVAIDLTGILFADVFAGYREQTYDDPVFGQLKGPSFGGNLTWNPTGLTTVKAEISRSTEETTLDGATGFLTTRVAASVDHELLRNLIISIQGSYQLNDYDGNAREDELQRGSIEAKYLMHRNFYLSIGYDYQNRESSVINENYTVNTFMIRLEGQL